MPMLARYFPEQLSSYFLTSFCQQDLVVSYKSCQEVGHDAAIWHSKATVKAGYQTGICLAKQQLSCTPCHLPASLRRLGLAQLTLLRLWTTWPCSLLAPSLHCTQAVHQAFAEGLYRLPTVVQLSDIPTSS